MVHGNPWHFAHTGTRASEETHGHDDQDANGDGDEKEKEEEDDPDDEEPALSYPDRVADLLEKGHKDRTTSLE